MAYNGLGVDGHFLGIESGIAIWKAVSVSGVDATFSTLTTTTLIVTSSANIPAFDTLTVNIGGTSALGTVISGVWNGDVITEIYGGTGQSSFNPGDILYANAANVLTVLPSGDEGDSLKIIGGTLAWGP